MSRLALLLCTTALLTACIDFVEPSGNQTLAAVLEATVRVLPNDTMLVEAKLRPGLDAKTRDWRTVRNDTLFVNSRGFVPDSMNDDAVRFYHARVPADTALLRSSGLAIRAPVVDAVRGAPPSILFNVPRRAAAQRVSYIAGQDVTLRIGGRRTAPVPSSSSWRVELDGDDRSFRVGGSGMPPEAILVPAAYVPGPGDVTATLFVLQTREVRSQPDDYVAIFTLDARVGWTLTPGTP